MTLLAVAYLTVQYMLALHETRFLWVLGVIALAEPFLLGAPDLGHRRLRGDRLRAAVRRRLGRARARPARAPGRAGARAGLG